MIIKLSAFSEALKVRCPLCGAEPKVFCVGAGKRNKGAILSTLHNERLRAAQIAPHDLFRVWSPDTVAECLDGVDMELYRRLYEAIPADQPAGNGLCNGHGDNFDERCLALYWNKLSIEDKTKLNALAKAHEV